MSEPTQNNEPQVRIDRLVLDIPGFDPLRAKALALGIANGLAGAGAEGERKTIGITLDPTDAADPDLAGRIVAALMQRLA
jgi:hypothetical protein